MGIDNKDYFITDDPDLESIAFNQDEFPFRIINSQDMSHSYIINLWRNHNEKVVFSRNITIRNNNILSVDTIFDKRDNILSNITDKYLISVLLRNKNDDNFNIISTIQSNQDNIIRLKKNSTFVMQGCAGSGKTMVLLNRIRYLLYNHFIDSDEYLMLIPNNAFKDFIYTYTKKYRFNDRNIFSYKNYYKFIAGNKLELLSEEHNESVFSEEYLSYIYSEKFMQVCCLELIDKINNIIHDLIEYCEDFLNKQELNEKKNLENQNTEIQKNAVKEIINLTKSIILHLKYKFNKNFSSISELITIMTDCYNERKAKIELEINQQQTKDISIDDVRILDNISLNKLKLEVDKEEALYQNASIFTKAVHQIKLNKLKAKYEVLLNNLKNDILIEEQQKNKEKEKELNIIFDGITLKDFNNIIIKVTEIYNKACQDIEENNKNLNNIKAFFGNKYSREIDSLIEFINKTKDIEFDENIKNLQPLYENIAVLFNSGNILCERIYKYLKDKNEKDIFSEFFKFFHKKNSDKLYSYINTLLFNNCKRNIKNKFNIKISSEYKHYWYLNLYCRYLTRPKNWKLYKYIFADEAQDLSLSELKLIKKINDGINNGESQSAIFNLFGDINQMVSQHGIKSWSDIDFISDTYTLNDNFRNTNQIIEYCNNKFPFKMTKIGVDMEDVTIYKNIDEALDTITTNMEEPTFIVKDDYMKVNLEKYLDVISGLKYSIYTVISAKGLEFKNTYVIDMDMTKNEKYIAYTRALIKLNVINKMPDVIEDNQSLIITGEDSDEDEIDI